MKRKKISLTIISLFLMLHAAVGQTMPTLGATSQFALFTATGAFGELGTSSTVTGDVGTNAGIFTVFPPGTLHGTKQMPGSAETVSAATDVLLAYSDLNQGGTSIAAVFDGLTLTPGVYTVATAATMGANGILTLDAQGDPQAIFIIRIGGAFVMASNSSIILKNGASLSRVFWQINGQLDVGVNASFRGTAIANGAINLLGNATLNGRALSTAGAILLYNNTVTIPTHFRSRVSGNWDALGTWESSADSISWINASVIPSYDAVSVSISNEHTVSITTNAVASVLTITPGAHLTLNAAQTLSADIFTISSDIVGGAATYVTNGTTQAIQTRVKQQLTAGRNWYVSSPVENANASTLNLSTGTFMVGYNEPLGSTLPWITESSTLTPLKGYIAVSPVTVNPTITFAGTLNDGAQTIALSRTVGETKEGFNLVGNPYPSHLNWTEDIATSANVLPTLWYRTFVGNSYEFQTYNIVSRVGIPENTTGIIAPMQAFWVRANQGGGTLALDNVSRMHDISANRLKAPASETNNQIVRLQVANGIIASEAVLYYNENAVVGFNNYDSPIMSNDSIDIPELYMMAGNEKVVINGLPEIVLDEEIQLGFMTLTANDFTLSVKKISNMPADIKIVLLDNRNDVTFDLTAGEAYSFTSEVTDTLNRFSLILKSSATNTNEKPAHLISNVKVYMNENNQIVIDNLQALPEHATVTVINLLGQQIIQQAINNATTTLQPSLQSGIYLVKVTNCATKKVIVN